MINSSRHFKTRLERLEALYAISNIVNTTLEPQKVLKLLLKEVVRLTDATGGSICLLDQSQGILTIETAVNINRKKWKSLRLALGVGVTGWVAWRGKPLRVNDVRRDPRYVSLKSDIRSELAVPLILEERVIGVINVDSTKSGAFAQEDEDLLMAVANQSARVIETARLHDTVRNHALQMESLAAIGHSIISTDPLPSILERIVDEGLRMLHSRGCILWEVSAKKDFCKWIEKKSAGRVSLPSLTQHQNKLLARDGVLKIEGMVPGNGKTSSEGPPKEPVPGWTILAAPVPVNGELRGMMTVYFNDPHKVLETEEHLLHLLANQAALAIENTGRYEQLNRLEESLRRAERLSLLGTLAAEIAHEIRNPITIINLLMEGLRDRIQDDPELRDDLGLMAEKISRIDSIVEHTLELGRNTEPSLEPASINEIVEDLLLFLNFRLGRTQIATNRQLDRSLPEVPMDAAQIQQVLLNLMLNAIQAMGEGGKLTIKTGKKEEAGRQAVYCQVEDNGPGIPEEVQEKLFDPFFTNRSGGTGLGLFISNKLVRRHGGRLKCKSRPGKGSRFTMLLPVDPVESLILDE